MSCPVVGQPVLPAAMLSPAANRKGLLLLEQVDDFFQLIQIFALFSYAPEIPFKGGRSEQCERHQSR
jgi:hypothetical protein